MTLLILSLAGEATSFLRRVLRQQDPAGGLMLHGSGSNDSTSPPGQRAPVAKTLPSLEVLRHSIMVEANERMTATQLIGLIRAVDGRDIGYVDQGRAGDMVRDELLELDGDRLVEVLHRVEVGC